jgi:uncharacterized caspase-like protein
MNPFRSLKGMVLLIAVPFLCFFLSGCAGTKMARIVTEPADARIYINDEYVGRSPLQYEFYDMEGNVQNDYLIRAEKDGYRTSSRKLTDRIGLLTHIPDVVMLSLEQVSTEQGSAPAKHVTATHPSTSEGIAGNWAVVIGISEYRDTRIPSLRYASADARSFHQWLVSQEGGRYAPQRVLLLVDAEATGERMRSALFEWLKQALAEDMVTIFFAGHGSPESPDNPGNLFLLPYDAKYDNIPSTGFPMWDIETALKRYIRAGKVVVIADACHAAGIGQPFDLARRANRALTVNPISSSLGELSMAADGVAIFSASADNQYSREGREWGGGHGVFTHFLLEGLKGGADFNKDGKVNLGELNLYLSEQVRRATKNAQSPIVSGKFDPAWSIGR